VRFEAKNAAWIAIYEIFNGIACKGGVIAHQILPD
jgi:hypothetical protein